MHPAAARSGTRRLVIALAIVSLAVAACGDDDDETSDTTDTTSVDSTAVDTTLPEGAASATTEGGDMEGDTDTTGDTAESEADRSEEAFVEAGATALNMGGEEQPRCIAQAVIDAIGYDQIEASGLTPEEFNAAASLTEVGLTVDDAVGPQLHSDLLACGDLVEAFASSPSLTPEQADCSRQHLTHEVLAESIVIGVLEAEPSADLSAAAAAAQECASG